jgi:hypothetical protein
MMKEEFEKRIGLVITSEEYEVIEAAYMGMPESVDKDKFVKIWLREGGIQELFDRQLVKVNNLRDQVKHLEAERKEQVRKLEGEVILKSNTIRALKDKLAGIGAVAMDAKRHPHGQVSRFQD